MSACRNLTMRLAEGVVKGNLRLGRCAEVMPQTATPRQASARRSGNLSARTGHSP
jgi:hypothetical protein